MLEYLGVNYPQPLGPHGYTQGGLAHGNQNQQGYSHLGMKINMPRQAGRGETSIKTTPQSFGISGLTDSDRSSPMQAGCGHGSYIGPIQNAGYAGLQAQSPISDSSFGGGGGLPYIPGGGGGAFGGGPPTGGGGGAVGVGVGAYNGPRGWRY